MQDDNIIRSQEFEVLIITSSIVLFILLVTVIVLFVIFQKRKIKFILERNEAEKKYLEEISKTQLEIQENTLKNVSWELHDNIGQLLLVANMQLNILNPENQNQEPIAEVKSLMSQSLQEIRSLSKSLNSEVINNLGLIESIENELKRFERLNFLKTNFNIIGERWEVNKKDDVILFRIIQEFFSNVIKHAKADLLEVEMVFNPDNLEITIEDNGVGFDVENINKSSGLVNMQSRAKMIGAVYSLDSNLEKGTSLKINYPRKKTIESK